MSDGHAYDPLAQTSSTICERQGSSATTPKAGLFSRGVNAAMWWHVWYICTSCLHHDCLYFWRQTSHRNSTSHIARIHYQLSPRRRAKASSHISSKNPANYVQRLYCVCPECCWGQLHIKMDVKGWQRSRTLTRQCCSALVDQIFSHKVNKRQSAHGMEDAQRENRREVKETLVWIHTGGEWSRRKQGWMNAGTDWRAERSPPCSELWLLLLVTTNPLCETELQRNFPSSSPHRFLYFRLGVKSFFNMPYYPVQNRSNSWFNGLRAISTTTILRLNMLLCLKDS